MAFSLIRNPSSDSGKYGVRHCGADRIYEGTPIELEEVAFMEGCNAYQIFFKVVMPLTKPSFATVGIFSFLWSYNDLFTQQFFLRNKEEWAITRLLLEISSKEGTNYGLMAKSCNTRSRTSPDRICMPAKIYYKRNDGRRSEGLTDNTDILGRLCRRCLFSLSFSGKFV